MCDVYMVAKTHAELGCRLHETTRSTSVRLQACSSWPDRIPPLVTAQGLRKGRGSWACRRLQLSHVTRICCQHGKF